jgi:hypothetical protein
MVLLRSQPGMRTAPVGVLERTGDSIHGVISRCICIGID